MTNNVTNPDAIAANANELIQAVSGGIVKPTFTTDGVNVTVTNPQVGSTYLVYVCAVDGDLGGAYIISYWTGAHYLGVGAPSGTYATFGIASGMVITVLQIDSDKNMIVADAQIAD